MIGLKTYLSTLSPLLGQSEEMLYERQRALVREGLLESVGGRGPGSGVRADEKALAVFLVSLLAHDVLAHAETVWAFCGMRIPGGKCPVTGQRTFMEALGAVLGNEPLAEKITGIMLDRTRPGSARLQFVGKNNKIITSEFKPGAVLGILVPVSALRASTSFDPNFIRQIAKDIAQFKKDGAS
jgi:hypothetical protein